MRSDPDHASHVPRVAKNQPALQESTGCTRWLELVEAVAALKAPVSLQTRVRVATGLVVVGEGSGIRG